MLEIVMSAFSTAEKERVYQNAISVSISAATEII